ncbi:Regulator putative TetR-family [Mycobacteroides abscessus subsp. massiliense]|nr:Regulator putative TetR-family [Mycobacteroides abscessus subsp. massiliense]
MTRERLTDAAGVVFGRNEYVAASIDEIAKTAGWSGRAVHSNFSGKQASLCELIANYAADRAETAAGWRLPRRAPHHVMCEVAQPGGGPANIHGQTACASRGPIAGCSSDIMVP